MAIQWKWDEKCGTATFTQKLGDETKKYDLNLYVGNCFLIMISEWEENGRGKYSIGPFFLDAKHMESCMKNSNIFDKGWERMTAIRINKAKCRNCKKIVNLLKKYMNDLEITIYEE